MANGNTPWGDEQAAIDKYGTGTTTVAPEAIPGMVQIGADRWRENVAGPVPLDGQGILMKGGTPTPPSGLNPLTEQYFKDREAFLEEQRQRGYIQNLMAQAGPVNANQAVEKAMRLEGQLGFAADVKSGMPITDAMKRWAPKMYWNSPANMLGLARLQEQQKMNAARLSQMAQSKLPSGPITAQEIRTPQGEVVARFVPGQGGHKYMLPVKPEQEGLTREQQFRVLAMRLKDIDNEMKAARELPKKDQEDALNALRNQRLNLYKKINQIGYHRVKNNETGKEFYRAGNPEEIPSTYSVLTGEEAPEPPSTPTEFEQD